MTKIKLELFQDINMHLFIESAIRGGVSMISTRYARANNIYMPNYNPSEKSQYLIYLDCNSLYSKAMCERLPVDSFQWISEKYFKFCKNPLYNNPNFGYILEVDLKYGKELHDLHNDYPLAPEKLNGKLIPNLNDKTRYILHYKTLEKYEELGLVVTKYYRILRFRQEKWLAPYINFNIEKRKNAKNAFEIRFYKDLNNSLFGRTIMNQRKFKNIHLTHETNLSKYVAKSNFDCSKRFNNGLHAVHMNKLTVQFNKPIYLGMSILDISKAIMYNFHYNYMSKFKDKKLLFTDTDSLAYVINTHDFYKEIQSDLQYFDTSGYKRDHFLYSDKNRKVMGKFKDELNGNVMFEFVGLRPKLYSYILLNWCYLSGAPINWLGQDVRKNIEYKRAKGTDYSTIKHILRHKHYIDCLRTKDDYTAEVTRITSTEHNLKTVSSNKIVLSYNDDKRFILEDGINTLALGHYKIDQT